MPALPAVPNVLQLRHGWAIGSDMTAVSVWHVRWSGTSPTVSILDTLAGDVYTAWTAEFAVYCGTDITFESITLIDLSSSTGAVGSHVGTTAGSASGGPMPAGVCGLINMPISRRYRGGKPRSYFPLGVPSDMATANTWGSAFISNINASLAAYISDIAGYASGGTSLGAVCSVSYYQGFTAVQNPITGRWRNVPKVRTGTIPVDNIGTATLNTKLGSQRRRNLHSV